MILYILSGFSKWQTTWLLHWGQHGETWWHWVCKYSRRQSLDEASSSVPDSEEDQPSVVSSSEFCVTVVLKSLPSRRCSSTESSSASLGIHSVPQVYAAAHGSWCALMKFTRALYWLSFVESFIPSSSFTLSFVECIYFPTFHPVTPNKTSSTVDQKRSINSNLSKDIAL